MDIQQTIPFWIQLQTIFDQVSEKFDKKWQVRKRILTSKFLVLFIFKVVLSKNKQGYSSILCELWDCVSQSKTMILPQEHPVAASSICEARQKLSETIFLELNQEILKHWQQKKAYQHWHGHRLFAIDGSKLNLPHELSKEGYTIQSKNIRHYPTGLLSTLYNLQEGMVYNFSLTSNLNERLCAIEHMNYLIKGDILILDRGYFSYLLLYESIEKGIYIVCRLQHGTVNNEIQKFIDSDQKDSIIDYYPSEPVRFDLKRKGFNLSFKKIPLRLIKYIINNEIFVCATTLIGEDYPVDNFPELYHGRWGIEELYKISKQFIEAEDFHSTTELGVKQELYAHLLLINLARMFEAEAKNSLPLSEIDDGSISEIQDKYWQSFSKDLQKIKINFKNCLLVVARYLTMFFSSIKCITDWLPTALDSIVRIKQKIRPGRHYPRRSFKPEKKWSSSNNLKLKKIGVS